MTINKKISQDIDINHIFRKNAESCLQDLEPWVQKLNQVILDIDIPHNDPNYEITLSYLFKMNKLALIHFLTSLIEKPTSLVEPFAINEIINNQLYAPLMDEIHQFANKENEISLTYWLNQINHNFPNTELSYEIVNTSIKIFYDFINSTVLKTKRIFNLNQQSILRKINIESIVHSILFDDNYFFEKNKIFNYQMEDYHLCIMAWHTENDTKVLNETLEDIISLYKNENKIIVDIKNSISCLWINTNEIKFKDDKLNKHLKSKNIIAVYCLNKSGISEFKKSYTNCIKFKNFFNSKNLSENFYSFNAFNLFLTCLEQNEPVKNFILEHLGKKIINDKDLINTLNAYIDSGLIYSKTAESIHTHRNTIIWRINKINENLPRPIDKNLSNIVIALCLLKFL